MMPLVMGIRDYFGKMGFKKALLGSSGGIDSAVIHALAAEALGARKCAGSFIAIEILVRQVRLWTQKRWRRTWVNSPYKAISIEDMVNVQLNRPLEPTF